MGLSHRIINTKQTKLIKNIMSHFAAATATRSILVASSSRFAASSFRAAAPSSFASKRTIATFAESHPQSGNRKTAFVAGMGVIAAAIHYNDTTTTTHNDKSSGVMSVGALPASN